MIKITVVMFLVSCNREDCCTARSCIDLRIEEFQRAEVANPPREVWKWVTANGITYFYFTSDCCDQYNYLYDNNCNEVCAPDGGFTGKGDGRCPEFAEPVEKSLVWKDERTN